MDAMEYEILMRKAFNTSKSGLDGEVHANVYRKLDTACHVLKLQKEAIKENKLPIRSDSIAELEYDVRSAAAQVTSNLRSALTYVLKTKELTQEIKSKLEKHLESLDYLQYDKEQIDNQMKETNKIFGMIKLRVG